MSAGALAWTDTIIAGCTDTCFSKCLTYVTFTQESSAYAAMSSSVSDIACNCAKFAVDLTIVDFSAAGYNLFYNVSLENHGTTVGAQYGLLSGSGSNCSTSLRVVSGAVLGVSAQTTPAPGPATPPLPPTLPIGATLAAIALFLVFVRVYNRAANARRGNAALRSPGMPSDFPTVRAAEIVSTTGDPPRAIVVVAPVATSASRTAQFDQGDSIPMASIVEPKPNVYFTV